MSAFEIGCVTNSQQPNVCMHFCANQALTSIDEYRQAVDARNEGEENAVQQHLIAASSTLKDMLGLRQKETRTRTQFKDAEQALQVALDQSNDLPDALMETVERAGKEYEDALRAMTSARDRFLEMSRVFAHV